MGYDGALVTELGRAQPARAKALLDMYGYADRNGDGLRERPDGKPLRIELAAREGARSRAFVCRPTTRFSSASAPWAKAPRAVC